jgi:hypothetical protein
VVVVDGFGGGGFVPSGADEDGIGGIEGSVGGSEDLCSSEDSSDGKRKLDESEDGGVREDSESIHFFWIDGRSLWRWKGTKKGDLAKTFTHKRKEMTMTVTRLFGLITCE